MKALFSTLVLMLLFTAAADAQSVNRHATDSAVNAQTRYLTWTSTRSHLKAVELAWVKSSGFVKGTAVLERRVDTLPSTDYSRWLAVGSTFTFTNGASESFIWPITNQDGKDYRIKVVTVDSTQKIYLYGALLRR